MSNIGYSEKSARETNVTEVVMKKIAVLVIGTIMFLSSSVVFAQDFAETTEYTFDDDVVTGDLVRPDGAAIVSRKRGSERSLIRVRQHFIPEMLKSVEDL